MSIKKYLLLIIILFIHYYSFSQNIIASGRVVDNSTNESLIGVVVSYGSNKTITDVDGYFYIEYNDTVKTVKLSCLGYKDKEVSVKSKDIGIIDMEQSTFLLENVTITAQLAVPRKTPIAVSTITSNVINERLGNKEFVEILRYSPGIYMNKQGGGWADSEIFMRGFDNTNIAIMVNGVPVNDMENGTVYWSNWASLSEVSSSIQAQRGIGANKVSSPSVGGSINIVTKPVNINRESMISYSIGNDGYENMSFSVSTGLMDNGLSLSILGSKTSGNGYAQGTNFEVYNYYINLAKKNGENQQIIITAFGAPQKHYMRSNALTKNEWDKVKNTYNGNYHWTKFNPDYGFDSNGQRKSVDFNKYHKPIISLKHIWQIDYKSYLTTNAYVSFGRGYSYTGSANSDEYSQYDWYGSDNGTLNTLFRDYDGTFDYAQIEKINQNSQNGSEMIVAKNMGNQDCYGLMSTYSNTLWDCIDWSAGIDMRYYKGLHKNVITDLYGGAYYIDPAREGVNIGNNSNATEEWKNEHLHVGDAIYRDYDSYIFQNGIFGQMEYSNGTATVFLSGSINHSTYWRYDRLYYDQNNALSSKKGFWSGNIKTGFNYNIFKKNNVFINCGFNSRAPQFKNGVFMSANTSNIINNRAINEKSASVEVGHTYNNRFILLNTNLYYTQWMDKSMTKKGKLIDEYYINMSGVDSKHIGIEFEIKSKPAKWIEIGAMLSIGDWKWDSDNVKGYAYNIYGQALSTNGNVTTAGASDHAHAVINMKDIHIGGSAQTSAAINFTLNAFSGFRIGGGYYYYDRNYAYYSLSGSGLSLGNELFVAEPWEIPSYGNAELWASYKFELGSTTATISAQVSNLFNNYYIEKAWNPSTVSSSNNIDYDDVYFFYSVGRTWSIKLKLNI